MDEIQVSSSPTASDDCTGNIILTYIDSDKVGDCAGTGVIRTWTAVDDCGNETKASQTMVPADTEGPVITGVGADGTYDCGSTPVFSSPTSSDDCGTATITFKDTPAIGGCAGNGIQRTWTAIDGCGNSTIETQIMLPSDITAPIIVGLGPDGTYACDENPNWSDPTASDDCSAVTLTFEETVNGNSITRTWTAEDECGNIATESQTFSTTLCIIDLALEKEVNNTTVYVGEEVQFTVTVDNESVVNATGVEVTDKLPSGYEYVTHATASGNYDPISGVWNIGNLGALQSVTLSVVARVLADGDYLNLAEVTNANETDVDSTPNDGVDTDGDDDSIDDPGDDDDGDGAEVEALPLSCLGDYAWKDLNADGIQSPNEPGLEGIVVTLINADTGNTVDQTETDTKGAYEFCGLYPGNYYVNFATPVDCIPTLQDQGSDDTDSDIDKTGKTGIVTVGLGENITEVDAGYVLPAKIGNQVWVDNGSTTNMLDNGDSGLLGVKVTLYDAVTNDIVETAVTDDFGRYLFCVIPGTYYVGFEGPTGYNFVLPNQGADNVDSDANISTGMTDIFTVDAGSFDLTWDAGFTPQDLAKIGNFVWVEDYSKQDNRYDPLDPNDRALEGVSVILFNAVNNSVVDTQVTDASGNYLFCVPEGSYYLGFNSPTGEPLEANAIGDDAFDSDADAITGLTETFTVSSGETDFSWDAGYVDNLLAKIGNQVWVEGIDTDVRNEFDSSDLPIENVMVVLYNGITKVSLDTVYTDELGQYEFSVNPGNYYMQYVLPQGFDEFGQNYQTDYGNVTQATEQGIDNDSDQNLNNFTPTFDISGGEVDFTWDAGFKIDVVVAVDYSNYIGEYSCDTRSARIAWTTASESNSDYFIVQRASDNVTSFVEVGRVDAAGNSAFAIDYELIDTENTVEGTYYYRLVLVDINGKETISNIITVDVEDCGTDDVVSVSIYPNPSVDIVNFDVNVTEEGPLEISLYARNGKLIRRVVDVEKAKRGMNNFTLDVTSIPDGTYVVSFRIADQTIVEKLNILK